MTIKKCIYFKPLRDVTYLYFTATYYPEVKPDYEYNVWTKPDCGGTEYENGNR